MSGKKSDPPRLAIWWLRHAFPGSNNDALTGDLIERFREGQTRGWFWRQVLIAFAVGVLGEVRSHWPQFCYAIAGVGIHMFLWRPFKFGFVHWNVVPWPWSKIYFDLAPLTAPAIFAMAALPVLAAGLAIQGTFRWISLIRTATIGLALITLLQFTVGTFGWLVHHGGNLSMLRLVFLMLMFFSFLASAWIGCRSSRRADAENRLA